MITLFTGMPGAGKTAALVDLLLDIVGDRPLFVDGLEGLTLPHTVIDANNWPEEMPDGAVLVVDEAQRVWRPRGPAAKVPPSVSEMETHRHRGIDIFLTTQSPRLIDANVRGLVGRHVHIRDVGWYGRWWYEWPETNEGTSWKTCPNKRRYKLPKRVFDVYKSASMHIKPIRGVPRLLYVAAALLVLLGVLAFMVYRSLSSKTSPKQAEPVPTLTTGPATSAPVPTAVSAPDERIAFIPAISDRPWTAPAYDHLRVVVTMPRITGALCVNDDCRCYHGKERLLEVSSKACAEWADTRPFDPYSATEAEQQPQPNGYAQPSYQNQRPVGPAVAAM